MSAKRAAHEYENTSEQNTYEYSHISTPKGTSKGSASKISLDDFIYELKQRNDEMSSDVEVQNGDDLQCYLDRSNPDGLDHSSHSHSNNSIHHSVNDSSALAAQLAKKEKDLILAAELGKALLDRNEELSRTNEQINEDYTHNLELLEQEKYALRKKLNSIEIEYENKIHELQTDLHSVREKLNVHFEINKQNEAENSQIIEELTEQNQRLTNELTKSTKRESVLEKEIQSLKEQFNARRTNFTDHIGQLEGLRDEINLLSRRKFELESKISSLKEEKESISLSLDESQFKILTMEKQLYEKEMSIQSNQKDLDELRRMNTHYQNRLDSLIKMRSFDTCKMQGSSLYNEIEMSSHSSGDDNNHLSPNYFSEEDIELSTPDNLCLQCIKHKQEMFEVYNKLKTLCDDLYKRRINETGSNNLNVSTSSNHDSGIQTNLTCLDEVNYIICDIRDLIKNVEYMQCITCQEFNLERSELDHARKENQTNKDTIQKLNIELTQLQSKLSIHDVELLTLTEENKKLKDDIDSMTNLSKDEIIKRAWKMRDDTISRKNTVEIELAKVRIELMHVNSQLLETIQQKVELSQQLEQWQVDMEILIEEQLKNKLSQQEMNKTKNPNEAVPVKKENLFDRIKFSKLLRYP